MARRRRLLVFLGVGVAVAVIFGTRGQWDKPLFGPAPPPPKQFQVPGSDPAALDPAHAVTLRCVVPGNDDVFISISGSHGSSIERTSFRIKSGDSRTFTTSMPGPFTITAITVERGGKTQKKELSVAIPAGQTREIRIAADGGIEVVPP